MRVIRLALLLTALALALSCAGPNTAAAPDGAGFWRGLAHGIIAPVTFVVSLFREDVSLYEIKNNGGFYDAGFMLGVSCWGGGGAAASRRRRRHDQGPSKVKPPSPA